MQLLNKAEAAEEARTTPCTLDRWRKAGSGPQYVKLGGRIFYDRNDLEEYLKSRRVQPAA